LLILSQNVSSTDYKSFDYIVVFISVINDIKKRNMESVEIVIHLICPKPYE
jgi:hypothetical protein